jgi:hypothetical protein
VNFVIAIIAALGAISSGVIVVAGFVTWREGGDWDKDDTRVMAVCAAICVVCVASFCLCLRQ